MCSSCNQSGTARRSIPLTAIWTSATDHSPMREQLGRALGMSKAICQPFPSLTWHQKYIYEPYIYITYIWTMTFSQALKIYLGPKYIWNRNIFLSNIYMEHIYEPWLLVIQYTWNLHGSVTSGWLNPQLGCICSSVLC